MVIVVYFVTKEQLFQDFRPREYQSWNFPVYVRVCMYTYLSIGLPHASTICNARSRG